MNATVTFRTTEKLEALYAKLDAVHNEIFVLNNLLAEAKNKACALYTEIEEEELRIEEEDREEEAARADLAFAESVAKTETAKSKRAAKKNKKSKKQSKKAAETPTETETPVKKLPVFDRPNHLIAYKFVDLNGKEIRREPVTETKKSTASKKKAKK